MKAESSLGFPRFVSLIYFTSEFINVPELMEDEKLSISCSEPVGIVKIRLDISFIFSSSYYILS